MARSYPKIELRKGTVYRLARPENIVEGNWYLVVRCAQCSNSIYLLPDRSGGVNTHPFGGEGRISTPCPWCHCDTTYAASDIIPFRATESISWKRPKRVEPSTVPRQKIAKKYPTVKPTFEPDFLENRPEAATLIARCISLWAEVETELALLLATMLQANSEAAIAMFLRIENSRLQSDVLTSAANVVLTEPRDLNLFKALLTYKQAVEAERNALVHGRFGGSDQIESGVAWIDAADYARFSVRVAASGVSESSTQWLRDRTYVYELSDLERIARDAADLHDQIKSFIGYVWSLFKGEPDGPEWRDKRYPELASAPRIAAYLRNLQEEQGFDATLRFYRSAKS